MEQLSKEARNKIIKSLLLNESHRDLIQIQIDNVFLNKVLSFFEKLVHAKLKRVEINHDWYKENMISDELEKEDIAWNAGLNLKSISNIHGSQRKSVVIKASKQHYDELLNHIDSLISTDVDISLTISLNDVSVVLTVNETLVVINAIAVMRAGLRGGIWSTMGKQIEKPLIITLCKILKVDAKCYKNTCVDNINNPRESDFYLENDDGRCFRCEVKLMGKGNPESADGAMARKAAFFLADKLSDQNKSELNKLNIKWVAMADHNSLQQMSSRLDELHISNTPYNLELTEKFIDGYLE